DEALDPSDQRKGAKSSYHCNEVQPRQQYESGKNRLYSGTELVAEQLIIIAPLRAGRPWPARGRGRTATGESRTAEVRQVFVGDRVSTAEQRGFPLKLGQVI